MFARPESPTTASAQFPGTKPPVEFLKLAGFELSDDVLVSIYGKSVRMAREEIP